MLIGPTNWEFRFDRRTKQKLPFTFYHSNQSLTTYFVRLDKRNELILHTNAQQQRKTHEFTDIKLTTTKLDRLEKLSTKRDGM